MSYLIAANWKMYKTPSEAEQFCLAIREKISGISKTDIIIAPSFPALERTVKALSGTSVITAAQDVHYEREGAFTGAVSAGMIKDIGCRHVIVGHSERRNIFGDSSETVGKKLRTVIENGMKAILCVGETQNERKEDRTIAVVGDQLGKALKGLEPSAMNNITIAYEPVWAIGTGLTASPEDAQEVHSFIREFLKNMFDDNSNRILYGGSVKPENIEQLLAMKDIDGGLIGGASLKVDSFYELIRIAESLS